MKVNTNNCDDYRHRCTHRVTNIANTNSVQVQSFQERVMDSEFLSSKGHCHFTL